MGSMHFAPRKKTKMGPINDHRTTASSYHWDQLHLAIATVSCSLIQGTRLAYTHSASAFWGWREFPRRRRRRRAILHCARSPSRRGRRRKTARVAALMVVSSRIGMSTISPSKNARSDAIVRAVMRFCSRRRANERWLGGGCPVVWRCLKGRERDSDIGRRGTPGHCAVVPARSIEWGRFRTVCARVLRMSACN